MDDISDGEVGRSESQQAKKSRKYGVFGETMVRTLNYGPNPHPTPQP